MHITAITVDANGGNSQRCIVAPTLQAVEVAVRSLDGQVRTLVLVELDEDEWLAIGDGNHGRYVVTLTDDDTFYLARSPAEPDGVISLVVGGQEAQWAFQDTSDLAGALLAILTCARAGSLVPDLSWVAR